MGTENALEALQAQREEDDSILNDWENQVNNCQSESELKDLLRNKPKVKSIRSGKTVFGLSESGASLPKLDRLIQGKRK